MNDSGSILEGGLILLALALACALTVSATFALANRKKKARGRIFEAVEMLTPARSRTTRVVRAF